MNRQSPSVTGLVPPRLFDLPTPNAGQATASTGTAPMNINEIILGYLPSEEAARELSDLYYRVSVEVVLDIGRSMGQSQLLLTLSRLVGSPISFHFPDSTPNTSTRYTILPPFHHPRT